MSRLRFALAAVAVLALAAAGCASDDDVSPDASGAAATDGGGDDTLEVVATTSIIGDMVSQIVGDAADVEVLMGPGIDPHAYSPSAAQAQTLREADLVVANGLRLEANLLDTIEAAQADGVTVVELGPQVDPIAYAEDGSHDHEDDEHQDEASEDHADEDHGEYDPHIWLDAGRMADAVAIITDALASVDGTLDDDEWAAMGESYANELLALDAELHETLAAIPQDRRQLVTNHESFGYWADAYDFEVVGTVIPGDTTQLDTSAAEFAQLVETIRDTGVSAIFSEATSSDRLAEAVAAEVGRNIEIVQLFTGALDAPGSAAGTYVGLMRTNAQLVVDALAN